MAYSYKTAISFGLVFVPVTLHACIKENDISFNTLHKKTGERIKYLKTCENCDGEVSQDEIVRGYQYEKDKYVTLTDDELDKLKTPKDRTIEIESFVDLGEIDPVYFDKSYFLNPTSAENAFALILRALAEKNKVGISKTMLGSKEQVVAIRAINNQMVLNTMFFKDEIQRSPANIEGHNISEKELSLARIIIENMSSKFEPEKYKDEYRERVLGAIKSKIKGNKITATREEYAEYGNIVNLMEALQKSVLQTPKKSTKSKSSAPRKSSLNSTSNHGEKNLSKVLSNSSKSAKFTSINPKNKKKSSTKQGKILSVR